MTTNADIITLAHRKLGLVASGQVPKGAELEDGMSDLQSLILGLPALTLRGRWVNKAVTTGAYTAYENQSITVTAPGSVNLPVTITAPYGCSRPPQDMVRVRIIGADADNAGLWVYVADKASWNRLNGLQTGDEFPFGDEDKDGVAAQLAVNISPDYGDAAVLSERTIQIAATSIKAFRARLMKSQPYDPSRPGGVLWDDGPAPFDYPPEPGYC